MKVCVFASSSKRTPVQYMDVARELGEALAKRGDLCINGGGKAGCMGALNEACRAHDGKIKTVIHHMWVIDKVEFTGADEMVVAKGNNLQERKRLLWEACDCVIVLPGGTGTYDELWEVACHNSVGLGKIPIVVLNVFNFYDGFVQQLERAGRDGMLYLSSDNILHMETDVNLALKWCEKKVAETEKGSDAVVLQTRYTTFIFRKTHSFMLGLVLGVVGTMWTVGEAALLSRLLQKRRRG